MRLSFWWLVIMANGASAASLDGQQGSLIYSDKIKEDYHSLVFKGKSGELVRSFDVGVNYSFYSDQISPDKSYSVVNFSESGVLAGDGESESHDIYLCAFVRMSDGCITAVESGEQCGGEWAPPNRWVSPMDDDGESLFNSPPSIEKTLKGYASGRKDRSQISNPKVMAYLLEGTSFQNLLVCDPPNENNKSSYDDLLVKLRQDGDVVNAKALEDVLDRSEKVIYAGNGEGFDLNNANVISGPFPAKVVDGADIFLSKSNDDKYPVRLMLRRKAKGIVEIVDKYEVSGSSPSVETVFFYPINGERNIFVLLSWSIDSRGVGTYGKLYQIYAYKNEGGKVVRNGKVLKDSNMFGIDGHQEGQVVSFSLKDASSIRRYIDSHEEYK
ncbi:hypothetical protein M2D07_027975 [Pseudomonas sp. BGr12]|uniref:hypothetical protein n=1 Tax=Pseudomonas sp. BGr12 TaxID=2936269 RepID=UPI00255A185F|nr:hypothetical protein [Pseudomonas sp. BJa5]MDL2430886.1 hypothetical protein [Pseudomonas sp. BJa5]